VSGALGSPANNVQLIGRSVFTTYLLAFEVTSALLVVAVVGAVVLARRPRHAPGDDDAPLGAIAEHDEDLDGPEAADPEATDPEATDPMVTGPDATDAGSSDAEAGGAEAGAGAAGAGEAGDGELAHSEVTGP
jgi:hypothetical protein